MNDKRAFLLNELRFEPTEHNNYYFLTLDMRDYPELENLISIQGKQFSVMSSIKIQLSKNSDMS